MPPVSPTPAPSPASRPIGPHLALGGGMLKAAGRAAEIGATAVQVFADNPAAWARRSGPPPRLPEFRERLAAAGIAPVAVHAAYLVNLAGQDPEMRRRSLDVLVAELGAAVGFGARYVNVHVGSHRGTSPEAGIRRVATGVAEVLARAGLPSEGGPLLVLENGSGAGSTLGATAEELGAIAEAAARLGVPESALAFCLDTAHAWGAGYALDAPAGVDGLLDDLDREIGLDRLAMVHLNDSRSERGSRQDRHEHVGAGRIGPEGLGHLLRSPRAAHATVILETPGMEAGYDRVNLERARALLAGEPLAPLPPEAFALPSRTKGAHPPEERTDAGAPNAGVRIRITRRRGLPR